MHTTTRGNTTRAHRCAQPARIRSCIPTPGRYLSQVLTYPRFLLLTTVAATLARGEQMMLPSDIALIEDPAMKKWVEYYAKSEDKFFKDFAAAWQKLTELGCKF